MRPSADRLILLALLGALSGAGFGADLLPGRLFHTPAERAAIDQHGVPGAAATRPRSATRRSAPPPAESPRLNGFVLRSDGSETYWLAPPRSPAAIRR